MKRKLFPIGVMVMAGIFASSEAASAQLEQVRSSENTRSRETVRETTRTNVQTRTNSDGDTGIIIKIDDPILGPSILISEVAPSPTPTPEPSPSPTPTPRPTSANELREQIRTSSNRDLLPTSRSQSEPEVKQTQTTVETKRVSEKSSQNNNATSYSYQETSYKQTTTQSAPTSPASRLGRLANNLSQNMRFFFGRMI